MPLMPYMSPAAIGLSVVRLRGAPSASKRSPMACNTLSGHPRPLDELMETTASSGMSAAACSAVMTFFMPASDRVGDRHGDAEAAGLGHGQRRVQRANAVFGGRGGRPLAPDRGAEAGDAAHIQVLVLDGQLALAFGRAQEDLPDRALRHHVAADDG